MDRFEWVCGVIRELWGVSILARSKEGLLSIACERLVGRCRTHRHNLKGVL
jgi:hypothetical protein